MTTKPDDELDRVCRLSIDDAEFGMPEHCEPASAAPYAPHIDEHGRKSRAPFLTPDQLGLKPAGAAPTQGEMEDEVSEDLLGIAAAMNDTHPRSALALSDAVKYIAALRSQNALLREELEKADKRCMEYVAINERQAVAFAKCQEELEKAREAIRDADTDLAQDYWSAAYEQRAINWRNKHASAIDAAREK